MIENNFEKGEQMSENIKLSRFMRRCALGGFFSFCLLVICVCIGFNSHTEENRTPLIEDNPYGTICEDLDPVTIPAVVRSEWPTSEEKENEVVELWEMFFDDDHAPRYDRRRRDFKNFARFLVKAVDKYQGSPADIGGQLPVDRNTHLVAAQIITRESSITVNVVGRRGEVGLMQVMPRGPAIAGYNPKEVRKDPELGIRLGVRWLAHSVGQCQKDIDNWEDKDWLGPLSFYSSGPQAIRKNGRCKIFKFAQERLRKTLLYRKRIDDHVEK